MPTSASPLPRHILAGLLILFGLLLQILGFTDFVSVPHLVSYALWLATLLLWRDLPGRTRLQAGILAGLGLGMLLVTGFYYGESPHWPGILDGNVHVVAMLVGVSFIGLIGNRREHSLGRSVTGLRGTAGTWLGVHLLGIILNLSTVFMIGDRLTRNGSLALPQLLALNRGLSSAALWSPFFASMGVVITLAPEMTYLNVLAVGLPLAMLAGVVTLIDLSRRFDLSDVAGFSLSPRSLMMPSVMALLVLLFHYWLTPTLSIVSIITFLLPAAALASNLVQGPRWTVKRMRRHVLERLPAMRGEVSLFLCAGLFTLGLSSLIDAATGGEWTLFSEFGAIQGVISFLVIVATAIAGLHPIIGVSVLASMLELQSGEQTLFAFVALGAWAVGTAAGPLSGINLSLQGRYGISSYRMMKHNLGYAAVMAGLVSVSIFGLDFWL